MSPRRTPSRVGRAAILLAASTALAVYFVHFWPTFHTANESVRFYFVQALVDHGSLSVDPVLERYGVRNVDRAVVEGRSYLDKAPGLSLLVLPAYVVLVHGAGMSTAFPDLPSLYHLLLVVGVVIPAVLGLLWVRGLVSEWTRDDRAALVATAVLSLATPYALYSTLFFGHAPAAAFIAGCARYAFRGRGGPAGALAGLAVLVDTAVAPLAALMLGWLLLRVRRAEPALWFILGGLPFAALQLGYNTAIFGEPFTFAYAHKASSEFAALHGEGLYGFGLPTAEALWQLSFGSERGLLYHAPAAAVGLGVVALGGRDRLDRWVLAGLCVLYFLWIAGFGDWTAGASYGPRHLTPMLPLLAVGVGVLVARVRGAWLGPLLAALGVFSAAMTWIPVATFPYPPVGFESPVAQLGVPLLLEGHFSPSLGARLGLSGPWVLLPPALLLVAAVWTVRPTPRAAAAGAVGLALFAVAVWSAPPYRAETTRHRAFIECLIGHPDTARAVCEEAGGRWHERACGCVLNPS